jgi:hypothetical protein
MVDLNRLEAMLREIFVDGHKKFRVDHHGWYPGSDGITNRTLHPLNVGKYTLVFETSKERAKREVLDDIHGKIFPVLERLDDADSISAEIYEACKGTIDSFVFNMDHKGRTLGGCYFFVPSFHNGEVTALTLNYKSYTQSVEIQVLGTYAGEDIIKAMKEFSETHVPGEPATETGLVSADEYKERIAVFNREFGEFVRVEAVPSKYDYVSIELRFKDNPRVLTEKLLSYLQIGGGNFSASEGRGYTFKNDFFEDDSCSVSHVDLLLRRHISKGVSSEKFTLPRDQNEPTYAHVGLMNFDFVIALTKTYVQHEEQRHDVA